jgi:hypothetical protein
MVYRLATAAGFAKAAFAIAGRRFGFLAAHFHGEDSFWWMSR